MLPAKVEPPLFTLRGHKTGVTALETIVINGEPFLVSGDEEGTLIIWDLDLFRESARYSQLLLSRVQSIKSVNIKIENVTQNILIVQSRSDGVQCLSIVHAFVPHSTNNTTRTQPAKVLARYPTFPDLFSRGDAIAFGVDGAVLAYPAMLENHMITVRIVGDDLKTALSGSAFRSNIKPCPVFDVLLKRTDSNQCLLYVAYEDGHLCLYSIDSHSTTEIPELGTVGLKIDLFKDFDLGVADFLSAFDVCQTQTGCSLIVCGSPMKDLIFIAHNLTDEKSEPVINSVDLKRKGVSAICIRPDKRLVAVALWDSTIRLYSLRSQKLLACLKHHLQQVQSVMFLEKSKETYDELACNLTNPDKQYLLCCASMEGTISISAIY